MSNLPFSDRRSSSLLSRVSEDLCQLRHDVGSLISHTGSSTRHSLTDGARDLAGSARSTLAAGTTYAAERLRSLRSHSHMTPSNCTLAGVALVGLIGFGIYALCKHRSASQEEYAEELETDDDISI